MDSYNRENPAGMGRSSERADLRNCVFYLCSAHLYAWITEWSGHNKQTDAIYKHVKQSPTYLEQGETSIINKFASLVKIWHHSIILIGRVYHLRRFFSFGSSILYPPIYSCGCQTVSRTGAQWTQDSLGWRPSQRRTDVHRNIFRVFPTERAIISDISLCIWPLDMLFITTSNHKWTWSWWGINSVNKELSTLCLIYIW